MDYFEEILKKQFLISELKRFYKENCRSPKQIDMQCKFGYPAYGNYRRYFDFFNSALEIAELNVNKYLCNRDGTETCYICGCFNAKGQSWSTKNLPKGEVICRSCYQHINTDYMNGKLDKNSSIGKATISQRVVFNVLNLEKKDDCNCTYGFNSPMDLYDKNKYKYINVKDSTLHKYVGRYSFWKFTFTQKETPDTYIMLGYDENRKHILRVWICKPTDKLFYDRKSISIPNTNIGIIKVELWEVDCKSYNDMLHQMSKKRKDTNGENCVLSNDDLEM